MHAVNAHYEESHAATVLLETEDSALIDEVRTREIERQLLRMVDALRRVLALRWHCRAQDVRVAVSRSHDLAARRQWWELRASWARGWAGTVDLSAELGAGPLRVVVGK